MSNPNFGDDNPDDSVVLNGPNEDDQPDTPDEPDVLTDDVGNDSEEPDESEPVQPLPPVDGDPTVEPDPEDGEVNPGDDDNDNTEETDLEVAGPGAPKEERDTDPEQYAINMPEVNYQKASQILSSDARNRALRSFLQGLLVDVVVAALVFLGPVVMGWNSLDDVRAQWAVVAFSFGKTLLVTIISYVMRRFADAGVIPTPKPPVLSGSPVNPETTGNRDDSVG